MNKMERLSYIIALLGLLVFLVNGQVQTPCPGVFEYQTDRHSVYGMIRIPSDGPVTAVTTRASFTIATRLISKYMGRLEPIGTHRILLLFNQGAPLIYRVYFPVTSPLPRLTALTINDTVICYGPGDVVGPTQDVSRITLEHKLFLNSDEQEFRSFATDEAREEPQYEAVESDNENEEGTYDDSSPGSWSNNVDDSRSQPEQGPQPTPSEQTTPPNVYNVYNTPITYTPPTPPPPPVPPNSPSVRPVQNCGTTANTYRVPLIHRGSSYERGDWPWAVAIYQRKDGLLQLLCAGTLVTHQHVVTAAHCVQTRTQRNSIRDFVVKVGVYNVEDWGEEFTITRTVERADVHEAYNASSLSNDVAVLKFTRPVDFNNYIRAVCLWSGDKELSHILGTSGVVVGWGPDDTSAAGTPRMVRMPIVSTAVCRASNYDFHKLTSEYTFCAGNRDGAGPCVGDSGGGLYIISNGVWQLRGVVSLSLRPSDGISCNLQEYVVFTDVAKYVAWIQLALFRN